ncbi:MAG: SDR family oxidoreductase [Holosporaceae bacterium]|nr:SDR family oxidoreductase [Holosporaceae bacterium]
MGLMTGKKGVVMGIANERSLAWGVAKTLAEHGAQMIFSYQSDILYKRVKPLAESIGDVELIECDVTNDESVGSLFARFGEKFGKVDFIVHAIAFSDKNELTGKYLNTSRGNFLSTLDISCYSFTSVCRLAQDHLADVASILTLTYLGAERVMPNYNVMGVAKAALEASVKYLAVDLGGRSIRVNGISAGPVKTLAAAGIDDFRYILTWNLYNSPLKRNTTLADVGGTAVFLLSDLSSGVTGEIVHVDSGYHVVGMKAVDAPDISKVPPV